MELLLECTDSVARSEVATLLKFILSRLKVLEKDILYKTQVVTTINEKGENVTSEAPVAITTRFLQRALSGLNTHVAKNWSRFDNFLDILYTFGVGEEPIQTKNTENTEITEKTPTSTISSEE
jgi:hypothetical protein